MALAKRSTPDGDDPVSLLRQEVQGIFAKQAKVDAETVDATTRAHDLSPEQMQSYLDGPDWDVPEGWTKRTLRIALAASKPRAETSFALISAHERTLARIRRTEDQPSGMRLGIAVMSIPARAERADDTHSVIIEATEVRK